MVGQFELEMRHTALVEVDHQKQLAGEDTAVAFRTRLVAEEDTGREAVLRTQPVAGDMDRLVAFRMRPVVEDKRLAVGVEVGSRLAVVGIDLAGLVVVGILAVLQAGHHNSWGFLAAEDMTFRGACKKKRIDADDGLQAIYA